MSKDRRERLHDLTVALMPYRNSFESIKMIASTAVAMDDELTEAAKINDGKDSAEYYLLYALKKVTNDDAVLW